MLTWYYQAPSGSPTGSPPVLYLANPHVRLPSSAHHYFAAAQSNFVLTLFGGSKKKGVAWNLLCFLVPK